MDLFSKEKKTNNDNLEFQIHEKKYALNWLFMSFSRARNYATIIEEWTTSWKDLSGSDKNK